ncbi:MAG: YfhO family protein [Phycisphaerae bacterium]|jgi:hypothetical protein
MCADSPTPDESATSRAPATKRWRGFLCGALLVLGVVVLVSVVFGFGPSGLLYNSYDYREIFTYHKAFCRDAVQQGRLPLWTPYTFSGWPFAANPLTQTFYPLAWLTLPLPQPLAVNADLILHLSLAAVGTYLLLRQVFRVGRGAASLGALVYTCQGANLGNVFAGHIQFYAAAGLLPFVLLAIERACGALSQPSPGGDESPPSKRGPLKRTGPWVCLGALLLGLQLLSGGLPYVWLTLVLAGLWRVGSVLCRAPLAGRTWVRELGVLAIVTVAGIGMALVQLLPSYELASLSNRRQAGYEYAATGSLPPKYLGLLVDPFMHSDPQESIWEYYGYVGMLPVLLAAVGLTQLRRERRVIVLVALAGLVILFALGRYSFLFPLLWKYVPGFDLFRVPARALLLVGLVIGVLSALGLDAIGTWLRRSRATAAQWGVLLAGLVCVATLADTTVCARLNRDRLILSDHGFMDEPIRRHLADALAHDRSWYRFWMPRALLRENHAYAVHARSLTGYDNMIPLRYSRFVHAMTDTAIKPELVNIITQATFRNMPGPFPFKILGVKYAAYRNDLPTRPEPVRRAWFARRTVCVPDEHAALQYMRSDAFQPDGEVVLEPAEAELLGIEAKAAAAQASPPAEPVEVKIEEPCPEQLDITFGPHGDGYLVLSETYYPGWKAQVNGTPVPVCRADSILRCVPLKAGDQHVRMTYAPASLRYGALGSAMTLLLLVVVLWRCRRAT